MTTQDCRELGELHPENKQMKPCFFYDFPPVTTLCRRETTYSLEREYWCHEEEYCHVLTIDTRSRRQRPGTFYVNNCWQCGLCARIAKGQCKVMKASRQLPVTGN